VDWSGGRFREGFEVEGIILRELEGVMEEGRREDLFSYDCYA
jgi:hypothetical protein